MIGNIADLLVIVLGFGVLIFVHELGHFLAAKWAGIRAEAFAVGMGPVALAWRRGIGLRFGSTQPQYTRLAQRRLVEDGTPPAGRNEKGEPAFTERQIYQTADQLNLGETEYSLRWLPLGGFVKMLGQEDLSPNRTSDDPRSYNSCPIGKRMIVVSAGVIMNIIFAAILYIIAFSVGVQFESPVLGHIAPTMPAATATAENAEQLNINRKGLQPGDRVLSIDDDPVHTFADIQIATAMARPDEPLRFIVERPGIDDPLTFAITPKKDDTSGLLGVGVAPASSTTLLGNFDAFGAAPLYEQSPLKSAGIPAGMTMRAAADRPITTYAEFDRIVNDLDGQAVKTIWTNVDSAGQPVGEAIELMIESLPNLQRIIKAGDNADSATDYESGLFGLVPLTRIRWIDPESPNVGLLQPGDLIMRLGSVHAPQVGVCHATIQKHEAETIDMLVLRDGQRVELTATIGRGNRIGVLLDYGLDAPYTAAPINRAAVTQPGETARTAVDTPVAPHTILPGTRIAMVGDEPIKTWRDLREAARKQTAAAHANNESAALDLTIVNPTPGAERETITLELSAADVSALHALGWDSTLSAALFEPLMTTRKADNPIHAIGIGVEETHKTMMLTYLTIDRLIRGSVGVEQLRGPVGIVHIGSKIADKGFIYILYFLAIISVNLAVINFLPLPIVDGGLFLFLVYEKFKGRPPSPAFQHWATVAGLFMIGTAFLVVTWNDVMRLLP